MTIKLINCTQWELNLYDDKSNLIRQVHVAISTKIVRFWCFSFTSGGDRFTYRDDLGAKLNFKPKNCIYFLEDKLEFLDNPGEWFYDKTSRTLYVMTPDGGSPEGRDVRGKVLRHLHFCIVIWYTLN